jgi:hypothetical protein
MAATKSKSRATRAAEQAAQDQDQQPAPEQQKQELPRATFDLGAGRIVYHRPSLTLPDGTVIDCGHETWGHAKAPAAMACLRKMAAERGVELAQ